MHSAVVMKVRAYINEGKRAQRDRLSHVAAH